MNETSINISKLLIQYKEGQRNFYGAALKQANLAWAKLPLIDLDEADLQKSDLRHANLAGANLNHADFSSANLENINLIGADLIRAKLAGANLVRALMSGANLSGANLRKTDLSHASLVGANLSGADFSGATLKHTNLNGANLKGANLSNTDLANVDLEGLNLEEAILSEAQFAQLCQSTHFKSDQFSDQIGEYADPGSAILGRPNDQLSSASEIDPLNLDPSLSLEEMDPFTLDPFLSSEEETAAVLAYSEGWSRAAFSNRATATTVEPLVPTSDQLLPNVAIAEPLENLALENLALENLPLENLVEVDPVDTAIEQHNQSHALETSPPLSEEPLEELTAIASTQVAALHPIQEVPQATAIESRNSKVVQSIQAVLQRRVQHNFQQALLEAYNYQCAITGCRISPLLETTFIQRQEASDADHASNGLVLRTDLRHLYRLHLIAIDPSTLTVVTAPSLVESEYCQLQGKPIFLPADKAKQPDPKLLAEHLRACKWYSAPSTSLPEVRSSEVVEPGSLETFSQYPREWMHAVTQKPKAVALGVTGLLMLGGTLWGGYNAMRWSSRAASPQEKTPAIASTTASLTLQGEVHPINVGIAAVTYPQQGIIVNQSAYVSLEMVEQLGVKPLIVPATQQALYKGKAYLKATTLKPLGVDLEWKPENRTMFLDAASIDVKPINLEINGVWRPQEGLIIHQSAYVPLNLANRLSIDSAKIPASDRVQYGNEAYLKATRLKEAQVAVNWDGETQTMVLRTQLDNAAILSLN